VIGGAGATVTVEALTGTQAPGAGVAQITAPLALNGVAHTVLNGVMVAAPQTITAGQRFGLVMAGTLTGLVGVITVAVQRVWLGAEIALFTVKGPSALGDDPAPVPTMMSLGTAQGMATTFAMKYRGNTCSVRDAYGNVVFTSPNFTAPLPGSPS
jgi:hypothetical protein